LDFHELQVETVGFFGAVGLEDELFPKGFELRRGEEDLSVARFDDVAEKVEVSSQILVMFTAGNELLKKR
jgi:hypothetical protein